MTPLFVSFVETRFKEQMSILYPGMPLAFSNTDLPKGPAAHAVIHVLSSEDVFPMGLGMEAKSRNVGVIQIDVYTPPKKGSGPGARIAKAAGKIFRRHESLLTDEEGLAVFKDPAIQDRGEVRGFQKHMVSIPYRYDFNGAL